MSDLGKHTVCPFKDLPQHKSRKDEVYEVQEDNEHVALCEDSSILEYNTVHYRYNS